MAKYKVAVATNDGVNVNVHFGHAAAFDIYEVDEASGKYEKIEVRLKPEHCDGSCGDGTCGQREVDIALPISEAIAKINIYRNKIAERALRFKSNHND